MPQILLEATKEEREKKVKTLLIRFGIESQAKQLPGELSGGQQQRTAIARALINDPDIILADEPVGNLDSKRKQEVMDILKDLNEKDKKTIILVTHDPSYLSSAHRVFYMKDGQIVREGKGKKYVFTETPVSVDRTGKPVKLVKEIEKEAEAPKILLPDVEAKVKSISDFILKTWDNEAINAFEDAIRQRIEGKIDAQKLKELLDKPLEEGGVGLYKQTAGKFSSVIEEMINDLERIDQEKEKTKEAQRIEKIRHFILDDYKGRLSQKEIDIIDKIAETLSSGASLDIDKIRKVLRSREKGVSFSKKDARSIVKRIKILIG